MPWSPDRDTQVTLAAVWAEAIGIPVTEWPGRCNEIALAVLNKGLLPGATNHYGHYYGPVTVRWFAWNLNSPFQRHGWLAQDEQIIDPTRWCFTGEEPFVYVGPDPGHQYDWGGQGIREALRAPFPFACEDGYGEVDAQHRFCTDHRVELTPLFVDEAIPKNMFGEPQVQLDEDFEEVPMGQPNATLRTCQVFWIANAPIHTLGDDGRAVIRYLMRDGHRVKVPVDTQQWAEGRTTALEGPRSRKRG